MGKMIDRLSCLLYRHRFRIRASMHGEYMDFAVYQCQYCSRQKWFMVIRGAYLKALPNGHLRFMDTVAVDLIEADRAMDTLAVDLVEVDHAND